MRDQISKDNWRLQEDSTPDDKWLLRESEQRVTERWELQDAPLPEVESWQPVEYVKPRPKIGAWILPTIITLALLLVLGYTGIRVLPPLLGLNPTEPSAPAAGVAATATPAGEATPVDAAAPTAAPIVEATATMAPLPTVPPTPPPPPVPVDTVLQRFATVNAPNGLNARMAPSTDATVIRVLENGETLWVFDQQGEWLEVFVAETPINVDLPFVGVVGFAAAEFFSLSEREVPARLVDQVLAYTGKAIPPTPTAVVQPEAVATDATADEGTPATEAGLLTVTVNAPAGVNIRREPTLAQGTVIRLLENGVTLPAIARTVDNQWIQVTLPDGVNGWIAAEFLVPSGDILALPVPGQATAAPVAPAQPAESAPGEPRTTGVEVPVPYTNVIPGDDVPAVFVTVPDGVNVRRAPTIDAEVEAVAPQGAVLSASGRSSDGLWVQVELPTGVLGWVFRDTVNVTGAVGALPAVDGGPTPTPTPTVAPPVAPVLLPTPTPTPEPTVDATVTATVIPFFLPLYATPATDGEQVARFARGAVFTVTGRNAGGDWLQVVAPTGDTGWVPAGNVRVSGDVSGLPVTP